MTDLVGGQIPMGVVGCTAQSLGLHKSGGLRILAITSATPLLAAPDLPTVAQAGFPGIANESSYGLLAPAGTPKPIIDKIASTSRALLSTPEYQRLMIETGFEATPDRSGKLSQGALRCGQVLGAPGDPSRPENRLRAQGRASKAS